MLCNSYRFSTVFLAISTLVGLLLLPSLSLAQATDLLPSWNEGPTKTAIIEFVKATTDPANPKFVSPEARIEGIHFVIGRRPVAAFGNSIGDKEMLEYTQAGSGPRLMLLVHHDDAEREYAYGPQSKVGTFTDALIDEAKSKGWIVVSMKNDWKRIFAFNP